ncbi:MAG TPA: hypothetical protein ENH69_01420, partial [Candidatus Aerophobetes bacterium]|nr:hypothetical protein [Candidatus Aerophobetes bacterium]
MSQNLNKESGWFLGRSTLWGVSVAVAACFTLIGLYSMGALSLELALVASIVPLLLWWFSNRQELLLLTVIAAYFAGGYFSASLVAGGLLRSLFLAMILL